MRSSCPRRPGPSWAATALCASRSQNAYLTKPHQATGRRPDLPEVTRVQAEPQPACWIAAYVDSGQPGKAASDPWSLARRGTVNCGGYPSLAEPTQIIRSGAVAADWLPLRFSLPWDISTSC